MPESIHDSLVSNGIYSISTNPRSVSLTSSTSGNLLKSKVNILSSEVSLADRQLIKTKLNIMTFRIVFIDFGEFNSYYKTL
jgi:hypothetical protein